MMRKNAAHSKEIEVSVLSALATFGGVASGVLRSLSKALISLIRTLTVSLPPATS